MMDSEDLQPAVLSVAWVFASLSLAVVVARLWIRTQVVRQVRIDDYLIIFTMMLSLGNSAFLSVSARYALGKHIETVLTNPLYISYTLKYVFLCEFFAIMCPCFGRISFALMLLSLLPPNKVSRRILQFIIAIAFIVDLSTVIISFSQCRPIEAFWDMRPDPDCWPKTVQQYTGFFQGSLGSAVDLILACFPASLFWNLKMAWKQKAALSSIMGLGIFAMIASIIKTIQLQAITATEDITFEMAKLAIWWTLEANFVLIAVSIPTLRPILMTKRGTSKGQSSNGNSSWKKGPTSSAQDSHRPFEALHEPSHSSSMDEILPVTTGQAFQLNDIRATGGEDHTGQQLAGIRRDITVSVSYDESGNIKK